MGRALLIVRRVATVAALSLLACDSPFGLSDGVNVRVANNSSFAFGRVKVVFPENEVDYGSLGAHRVSEYAPVETAYRYAYIEVELGGEVLKIQPIDYVGESHSRRAATPTSST